MNIEARVVITAAEEVDDGTKIWGLVLYLMTSRGERHTDAMVISYPVGHELTPVDCCQHGNFMFSLIAVKADQVGIPDEYKTRIICGALVDAIADHGTIPTFITPLIIPDFCVWMRNFISRHEWDPATQIITNLYREGGHERNLQ